ncbi:MAG: hypothetical protein DRO14_04675 [Thermoprotei archaeon]|nr:MAG: hypothetical protein DRO14_04675 [Thermoprotei archaeon]
MGYVEDLTENRVRNLLADIIYSLAMASQVEPMTCSMETALECNEKPNVAEALKCFWEKCTTPRLRIMAELVFASIRIPGFREAVLQEAGILLRDECLKSNLDPVLCVYLRKPEAVKKVIEDMYEELLPVLQAFAQEPK